MASKICKQSPQKTTSFLVTKTNTKTVTTQLAACSTAQIQRPSTCKIKKRPPQTQHKALNKTIHTALHVKKPRGEGGHLLSSLKHNQNQGAFGVVSRKGFYPSMLFTFNISEERSREDCV
jgi:hypothetical protein